MRFVLIICMIACAAAGSLITATAADPEPAEPELVLPIRSEMALIGASGQPVVRPDPGDSIRIRLRLTNLVDRSPGKLDFSRAFVRVLGGEPANCAARVRMFRATGTVSSLDQVLDGSLILSLSHDGNLALADPGRPPASNTLALRKAEAVEPRLVTDATRGLFFLQSGERGPIYRIALPDLSQHRVEIGHDGVLHLDDAGAVVIGRRQMSRLDVQGVLRHVSMPDGDWSVRLAGPVPVLDAGNGRFLIVPKTRAERFVEVRTGQAAKPLAASSDGALLVTGGSDDRLVLHFPASGQSSTVVVGKPVVAAWVVPDGRHVLALHDNRRTIAVIDAATGDVVQAAAMGRPVQDVVFAGGVAFVQIDNSSVLRIALTSFGRTRRLDFTRAAVPAPELENIPDGKLARLSVLPDGRGVLAPGFGSDRAAILTVDEHSGLNARPATVAIPLRTGRFWAAAAVSRGFTEHAPGLYEAPFVARTAGPHLLVVADNAGQFSACHPFEIGQVAPEEPQARTAKLLLDKEASKITFVTASLIVFHATYEPATKDRLESVSFEVMDMGSPWRSRAMAHRRNDGGYALDVIFPRAGTYVLQPRAAGHYPAFAKPLVISVLAGETP